MNQVSATVLENRQLLPEFTRPHARSILRSQIMWLNCAEIAQEAKPGQFVMVRCGKECVLPRPLSIHKVNEDGIALFFAVWEDGKGTSWLSQREVGDSVNLFGPLGNGFPIHPGSHNLLLVAGGIGIAPLLFLSHEALNKRCSVTLLLGASTTAQLYPGHLLPPEVELVITTEDGTAGKKGMITDLLPDFVDRADQIFACGPVPMYCNMHKLPELKGKPVQISLEARMGCGRGVCYGCTVKTKGGLRQVCKDGPVFDLEDILWHELNCF